MDSSVKAGRSAAAAANDLMAVLVAVSDPSLKLEEEEEDARMLCEEECAKVVAAGATVDPPQVVSMRSARVGTLRCAAMF